MILGLLLVLVSCRDSESTVSDVTNARLTPAPSPNDTQSWIKTGTPTSTLTPMPTPNPPPLIPVVDRTQLPTVTGLPPLTRPGHVRDVSYWLSDSIIQVRGKVVGSGFIINEYGDALTNAHVVGESGSVEIQPGDGRNLRGRVVLVDREWDLALIELPDPEERGFYPLPLGESNDIEWGQNVIIFGRPPGATHTVGISGDVIGRVYALDGAEWMRVDTPIYPGTTVAPLHGERMIGRPSEALGIVVSKEPRGWKNEGYTYVLTAEAIKERLDYLKSLEGDAPAKMPVPEVDGAWAYRSYNGKQAYANCVPLDDHVLSDRIALDAKAFACNSDRFGDPPSLEIRCLADGMIFADFYINGLELQSREHINAGTWTTGEGIDKRIGESGYSYGRSGYGYRRSGSDYPTGSVYFSYASTMEIARLLHAAENSGKTIQFGAESRGGTAVGIFDPTGFATNYWRLPCTQ